jgi:uncharacterized SAM-binding protein YcdF (DUF218 family)
MAMIESRPEHLTMERPRARPAPARSHAPAGRWPRRIALAFGAMAVAGAGALCLGYAEFASQIEPREPTAVPRTDAIVVVTGGSQRIGDAIGLLGAERGSRLLISGVNEKTGREELAKMNPASRDLLACCVDLDYRARNTIGNAIEARRWVRQHGFNSLTVVTSNYHMPRVMAEFAHAMPSLRLVGHPVVTDQIDTSGWWHRWSAVRLLAPEYAKYLVTRLRGQLETDPETSRLSVIIGGRKPVSPKPADLIGPESEKRTRLNGHRNDA